MSAIPRALVDQLTDTHTGDRVIIRGENAFHLLRVLRTRPGDRLRVFDGQGLEAHVRVESIETRGTPLCLVTALEEDPKPGVGPDRARVIWLQGYPKGDKLDTVVRQATELGVLAVWPVYTARSVPRPPGRGARDRDGDARSERLRSIVRAAATQCGRADVPEVCAPRDLSEALVALAPSASPRILPWEESNVPLARILSDCSQGTTCAVLVGPEGGLDAAEVHAAEAYGFVAVSLGPRILRTETVAPALLGALSLALGDLGNRGL